MRVNETRRANRYTCSGVANTGDGARTSSLPSPIAAINLRNSGAAYSSNQTRQPHYYQTRYSAPKAHDYYRRTRARAILRTRTPVSVLFIWHYHPVECISHARPRVRGATEQRSASRATFRSSGDAHHESAGCAPAPRDGRDRKSSRDAETGAAKAAPVCRPIEAAPRRAWAEMPTRLPKINLPILDERADHTLTPTRDRVRLSFIL